MPGRNIYENIVVAQEMIHSMRRMRGKTGYFAIKVDLAKAFDRLSWSFISHALHEVGLPLGLINLIMECVTVVDTNVLWNGSKSDYFSPECGVRQGDPISPYLFVMCLDKLSHIISDAVDRGEWRPLKAGRLGPSISFLMFADDLLLFGQANSRQLQCVLQVLNDFCDALGQRVSRDKTSIYFSRNVTASERRRLSQ